MVDVTPGERFVAVPVLPDLLAALEKWHGPRALDAAAKDRLKVLVSKAVAAYVAAPMTPTEKQREHADTTREEQRPAEGGEPR